MNRPTFEQMVDEAVDRKLRALAEEVADARVAKLMASPSVGYSPPNIAPEAAPPPPTVARAPGLRRVRVPKGARVKASRTCWLAVPPRWLERDPKIRLQTMEGQAFLQLRELLRAGPGRRADATAVLRTGLEGVRNTSHVSALVSALIRRKLLAVVEPPEAVEP